MMLKSRLFKVIVLSAILANLVCSILFAGNPGKRNHSEQIQFKKYWENSKYIEEYLKKADESYKNYMNQEFDSFFEIDVIMQSPNYGKETEDNILIVVYRNLYNPLTKSHFKTYVNDLEVEGYSIKLVTATNNNDHVAFRNYISQEWNDNFIQGAFLIGGLPVAWYEMPMFNDEGDTTGWNFFPCDLYFMDTDGDWIDEKGNTGIYDDHTGAVSPDMWVSRLYTPTMTYHDLDETILVSRYLQKNHDYREGTLRLKNQALCYVQEDWAGPPEESEVYILYDEVCFQNQDFFGADITAADYRSRVRASANNKYEWLYLAAHSDATYHGFKDEPFVSREIDDIDVQVLFYLNFNCSAALFTHNDCLCSWYVMQEPYGLFSLGSSKPGSMVCQAEYYIGLSGGSTLGDAYLFWGFTYFDVHRDWHYGLICMGDPTLKISRFMKNPGPKFCYAISPDRDVVIEQKDPIFKWTKTDNADYYKLVIEQDQFVWTSDEITDTTFQIPDNILQHNLTYNWTVKAYSDTVCIDFSQMRAFKFNDPTNTSVSQLTNPNSMPHELKIIGNYPNPFNASTTISFIAPNTQPISVNVYNILGQNIKTLIQHEKANGKQNVTWDGTDDFDKIVSSGIYFCKISDGNTFKIKKMFFLQ